MQVVVFILAAVIFWQLLKIVKICFTGLGDEPAAQGDPEPDEANHNGHPPANDSWFGFDDRMMQDDEDPG
jgi:hypothetical protein